LICSYCGGIKTEIFIKEQTILKSMPNEDDYTGELVEPVEDLSIIQPDGTRACYNWECGEGFGPEFDGISSLEENGSELDDAPNVHTLDDLTTLFLEGRISKGELEILLKEKKYENGEREPDQVVLSPGEVYIVKISSGYIKAQNESGSVLGYIEYATDEYFDNLAFNINLIDVIGEVQRGSIGTKLEAALNDIALTENVRYLKAQVLKSNKPAINFFNKLGYFIVSSEFDDQFYQFVKEI